MERPGEFAVDGRAVVLVPRGGDYGGKPVRIAFAEPKAAPKVVKVSQAPPPVAPDRIARVEAGGKAMDEVIARSADALGAGHRLAREAPPRGARR